MLQFYCFSISNLRYQFKKHGFLSLPKTLKIRKRSEVYVDEAFKEVFRAKPYPAASCTTYLYLYLFKYTDNITKVIVYLCSMTVSDDQIADFNPGRPVLMRFYSQMANIVYLTRCSFSFRK